MILALQALPLLLLIGLLFSGRVAPVPAVLTALAAAIPAAFVSLPDGIALPGFLAEQILRGAYLALQPMGVVLAGLLFHAAVSGAEASKDTEAAKPRRIFIATCWPAASWKVLRVLASVRCLRWRVCAAWGLSARRPAPWRCSPCA